MWLIFIETTRRHIVVVETIYFIILYLYRGRFVMKKSKISLYKIRVWSYHSPCHVLHLGERWCVCNFYIKSWGLDHSIKWSSERILSVLDKARRCLRKALAHALNEKAWRKQGALNKAQLTERRRLLIKSSSEHISRSFLIFNLCLGAHLLHALGLL